MKKIIEYLFFLFTISTGAGYFASYGYYSQYNFSITPFLSTEDLTIIFTRWIWIGFSTGFIAYIMISDINFDKESWWNKAYTKHRIIRRAFVLIPIIILLFVLAFLYKSVMGLLMLFIVICFLMLFAYLAVIFLKSIYCIEAVNYSLEQLTKLFLSVILFIVIIPFSFGIFNAHFIIKENIDFVLDNQTQINTITSKNLEYIGQTSKYLFIYDTKIESTTIYNIEKIQSIKFSEPDPEVF
jgi:hypothetical protein